MSEPKCIEALLVYEQADFDGIIVRASRQAIHETVDAYRAEHTRADALQKRLDEQDAEIAKLRDANKGLAHMAESLQGRS